MKVLIGSFNPNNHWINVLLGVFDNDEDMSKAAEAFQRQHEGRNYFKIEEIEVEKNSPLKIEF